jgi:hypothetical protein
MPMVTELQINANSGDFRGDYVTDMCLGLQIGEAFCATSAARAVVGPALNDASRMRRCAVRSISRS